jgi:hypothetical protein
MPAGRPTKYKPEYCELGFNYSLLGATDKEMAALFEVDEATINRWKIEYPEFCESLKRGKEEADAKVAKKLYHRALGYEHPEDKIFNDSGEPLIVPTIKHYPPDPTAAIFWLKNRQPQKWRDRKEHELTGKDGAPLQAQLSDEELDARIERLLAAKEGTT